ncbi:hypothetical protein H6784_01300 [Candidatus Nomurabacteria bacterium]|nr:hypothetical protein [Candidatus Nomurabacteria bacterium]
MRLKGSQVPHNQSSYKHFSNQLSETDERDAVFKLLNIAIHELLIDSFDKFHGCFVFLADGQVAGVLPPIRPAADPTFGQRPTTQNVHRGSFCATAP